jgi:hypothetical protein
MEGGGVRVATRNLRGGVAHLRGRLELDPQHLLCLLGRGVEAPLLARRCTWDSHPLPVSLRVNNGVSTVAQQ